jgi:hypothetical protein
MFCHGEKMNIIHKNDVGFGLRIDLPMVEGFDFVPTIDASGQGVFLHLISFPFLSGNMSC